MKNVIFLTQSGSLGLFASVRDALASRGQLGRAGFYVADSTHYRAFTAADSAFEASADVVREWEILHRARSLQPDRGRIAELERLRSSLAQCIGCGCLSLGQCQLANPGDRARRFGPGPRYWIGNKPPRSTRSSK